MQNNESHQGGSSKQGECAGHRAASIRLKAKANQKPCPSPADLGLARESALKEAETDATKRALMTFGNPFGLALYDKQQRQVSNAAAATTVTVSDTSLEPAVIAGLQKRIKALAPAHLEAFSKGFRSAFQVPDAVPSLAGLITTSRHQGWIEGFLAEVIEPSRMAT